MEKLQENSVKAKMLVTIILIRVFIMIFFLIDKFSYKYDLIVIGLKLINDEL
tara:strand:- start:1063 stop:1218 length:156 start_codon:yes stop_codon:yes gene_type:complete